MNSRTVIEDGRWRGVGPRTRHGSNEFVRFGGIQLPAPAECRRLAIDILPETSMSKMVFVNLPVRDLQASTAFYIALGAR